MTAYLLATSGKLAKRRLREPLVNPGETQWGGTLAERGTHICRLRYGRFLRENETEAMLLNSKRGDPEPFDKR